jgi:hypothetical protein
MEVKTGNIVLKQEEMKNQIIEVKEIHESMEPKQNEISSDIKVILQLLIHKP